jgi:hypothetical protein
MQGTRWATEHARYIAGTQYPMGRMCTMGADGKTTGKMCWRWRMCWRRTAEDDDNTGAHTAVRGTERSS